MGYHRAGFDVVGVDLAPQPHYPFDFIRGDALRFVSMGLHNAGFDAIHASPPCQAYSQAAQGHRTMGWEYPDLLGPTRDLLEQTGLPWVIENVPGAPMRADFALCGCQVGLKLRRVRWFETSWAASQLDWMPPHRHELPAVSVVGHGTPTWVREVWKREYGREPNVGDYRAAMGIDWMGRAELSQAIPPAYTEYVGARLLAHLEEAVA
jgi:DNA (cytosine-5)-methyltransferase 1